MYRLADTLLEQLKKLIRREFNRLGIFGFDELNAPRVTQETTALFDRMMTDAKWATTNMTTWRMRIATCVVKGVLLPTRAGCNNKATGTITATVRCSQTRGNWTVWVGATLVRAVPC